jgi:hypothetical protein
MSHAPVVTPFGPVANPHGNIVPLHRGVRPIPPLHIANLHGDTEQAEAITTIERSYRERGKYFSDEQAEIERKQRNLARFERRNAILADERRDLSIMRWQRVVRSFVIAVAVFAIVYFGGQEFLR